MTKKAIAKQVGWAAAGAAAIGAAVSGVGVLTVLGSMVSAAMRYESVDDGPDPLLRRPAAAPSRQIVTTADGAQLNVVVYGPAPQSSTEDIIVMAHGWTCNTDYWLPQINHVLDRYPERTIVAYDQRGHGDSSMGHARTTPALLGRDLNAVLGAVVPAGRKAVLMGHSMGGMTILSWAQQFADEVGERVSHVFLVSTACEQILQRLNIAPQSLPAFARPFRYPAGWLVAATPAPTPRLAGGEKVVQYIALAPTSRRAHVEFVDEMISACNPSARASCGLAMSHLAAADALDALRVPTTVVIGTEDKLLPVAQSEQLAKRLRENGFLHEYVEWDGIGHMSSIEAGERFNALLDDVLGGSTADEMAG